MTAELALTESPSLRATHAGRVDVLDKVGAIQMLPDNTHVTTEMVAAFYEVPASTIESLAQANADELAANGRRVLAGAELREFATPFGGVANLGVSAKARSLALYDRRAVLLVGMLLRDSAIARKVRQYLLDAEAVTRQLTPAELILHQAQQLVAHEQRLMQVEARVDGIEQRTGWLTALAYSKLNGLPTDRPTLQRLGARARAVMRAVDQQPVKTHNEMYGVVNQYPEWALEQAASDLRAAR